MPERSNPATYFLDTMGELEDANDYLESQTALYSSSVDYFNETRDYARFYECVDELVAALTGVFDVMEELDRMIDEPVQVETYTTPENEIVPDSSPRKATVTLNGVDSFNSMVTAIEKLQRENDLRLVTDPEDLEQNGAEVAMLSNADWMKNEWYRVAQSYREIARREPELRQEPCLDGTPVERLLEHDNPYYRQRAGIMEELVQRMLGF